MLAPHQMLSQSTPPSSISQFSFLQTSQLMLVCYGGPDRLLVSFQHPYNQLTNVRHLPEFLGHSNKLPILSSDFNSMSLGSCYL